MVLEAREPEGALLERELQKRLMGFANEHIGHVKFVRRKPPRMASCDRHAPLEDGHRYRLCGSNGSREQNPAPLRCSSRTSRVVSRRRSRSNAYARWVPSAATK